MLVAELPKSNALPSFAGLADPGPVAAALWTDDELEAAVHLDAIVTVVDAKNIQHQLQQQGSGDAANEAQKQIAYADTVLLNKVMLTLQTAQLVSYSPRSPPAFVLPSACNMALQCVASTRRS